MSSVPSGQHSSKVIIAVWELYQFFSFDPRDASKLLVVKTSSTSPRLTAFCSNERYRFSILDRLAFIATALLDGFTHGYHNLKVISKKCWQPGRERRQFKLAVSGEQFLCQVTKRLAGKSKPPAVRVVVDSGIGLLATAKTRCLGCQDSNFVFLFDDDGGPLLA